MSADKQFRTRKTKPPLSLSEQLLKAVIKSDYRTIEKISKKRNIDGVPYADFNQTIDGLPLVTFMAKRAASFIPSLRPADSDLVFDTPQDRAQYVSALRSLDVLWDSGGVSLTYTQAREVSNTYFFARLDLAKRAHSAVPADRSLMRQRRSPKINLDGMGANSVGYSAG